MVYISRDAHFCAAHKLYNEKWSKEKNSEIFGACANENWHGHNFDLIVTVKGLPDPESGFVVDLKRLSTLIRVEITEKLDHKNLNLDCPEFKGKNPTTELIAVEIYKILREKIADNLDISIRLWETPRNSVIYPPIS